MKTRRIEILGDSLLLGVQLSENRRYKVDNRIDTGLLSSTFKLDIQNNSRFGATSKKGLAMAEDCGGCSMAIMDFGGNDCNFDWRAISEEPDREHFPKVPHEEFEDNYVKIISSLRAKGITPVLATLPPIEPDKFFRFFCGGLNTGNVMKWLGDVGAIYRFQETYSRAVEKIAAKCKTLLADLRGAFLKRRSITDLFCDDGIHLNGAGQSVITEAFMDFGRTVSAR